MKSSPTSLLLALFACVFTAAAQDSPTRIADVLAMPTATAQTAVPVKLRGIVTYPNPARAHFYIHDGSGGMIVNIRDKNLCPSFGMDVEVTGTTARNTGPNFVWASAVDVRGTGNLPKPKRLPVSEAGRSVHLADWVEVEGVVLQARSRTTGEGIEIQIAGDNGWTWISLNKAPAGTSMESWWGARVRVCGLNPGAGILCDRPDEHDSFKLLAPGRTVVFAAPERDTAALCTLPPSAERVRVKGTVLDVRDGWIYLRDGKTAFRADRMVNYLPAEGWRHAPGVVPMPEFKAGAELELVGSPMVTQPALSLRYAQIKYRGQSEVPPPHLAKLADAASGAVANDLVTVRGRLANYSSGSFSEASAQGGQREVLRLDDDGTTLEVVLEKAGSAATFAAFKLDEIIEATGIVRPDVGAPAFRLVLRSGADARALGPDPTVARRRLINVAAIAIASIVGALAWVWLMQRKVAARTAELDVANKQLDAALVQERELGDLKTRFVSLVSHEFRTPLGITMSAVELMRHYSERLPATKRTELLDDIHGATLRMSAMMEQVLLLGRVEAGKIPFNAKPLDLAELGGRLADESLSSTNRKCPVLFKASEGLDGAAGDEMLIRHVFSNLISNAVKYSPGGTPVQFFVYREDSTAVFTVRDHGIGIPVADQARLFEAFHRAKNVGETPGTGLGLLIVKRCVDMHHGTISFDSREGEGTTFIVRLPLFRA